MSDNNSELECAPEPDVSPEPEAMERTWTTVRLNKSTRDRFNETGKKGESYDDVANRILDENDTLRAYIKRWQTFMTTVRADPALYARLQDLGGELE